MRLRQIVLVARDIAAIEADFAAVFGWKVTFRDPIVAKWGLQNCIIPVGGEFIEIVSPVQDDTSASRHMARIGGDGGYMAMFQVADRGFQTDRLVKQGVRVAYHSDQETYCLTQFHPGDCGGLILAWEQVLHPDGADWAEPLGYWHAAGGQGWQKDIVTTRAGSLRRMVIGNWDANALAETYAQLLDRPLDVEDGVRRIRLVGPDLGFEDRTEPGAIVRLEIEAYDRDAILASARERQLAVDGAEVHIAGVGFRLV